MSGESGAGDARSHQSISGSHQKTGQLGRRWDGVDERIDSVIPPRPRRWGSGLRPFAPAALVGLVVGVVLAATLAPAPSAQAGVGTWSGPGAWTNGGFTVQLESDHPAATVSAGGSASPYGLYAGLGSVQEIAPNGSVVGEARTIGWGWSAQNVSTSSGLSVSYNGDFEVTPASSNTTLGSVALSVNFSAPSAPSGSAANRLAFTITLRGWPLQHPTDQLLVGMPLWPQSSSAAYLSSVSGVGSTIVCRANDSGAVVESFSWGSAAVAQGAGGATQRLPASTSLSGGSGLTTVSVAFAPGAAASGPISFDSLVEVPALPAPSTALTVPVMLGLALAVAGAALGALVVRRSWRQPPRLESAEGGA